MQFVFACAPAWEDVLADELRRVFSALDARTIGEGWIGTEFDAAGSPAVPSVAFASQCLPDPAAIRADSISEWVQAIGPRIIEDLDEHNGPWRLHAFGVYRLNGPVGPRRAKLIE